jgi:DNA-binding NarL/FixJ family response regulator
VFLVGLPRYGACQIVGIRRGSREAIRKTAKRLKPVLSYFVLTPRERDLLRGITAGRTNREMATEFGLREQSIKNVLSTVYQKCQVRSRLELALFAIRHRLMTEDHQPWRLTGRKITHEDLGP